MSSSSDQPDQIPPIEIKQPVVSALLAWLFPGAGHLYQGRRAKGILYMACLVPMFVAGMYFGGGRVAYASTAPFSAPKQFIGERWQFICQAGIGTVALPALIERDRYLKDPFGPKMFGGLFRPPRTGADASRGPAIESIDNAGNTVTHPDEVAKWTYDYGFFFELGSVYTMIAGLMNILVVYDAYSGPLMVIEEKKKSPPEKEQAEPAKDQ